MAPGGTRGDGPSTPLTCSPQTGPADMRVILAREGRRTPDEADPPYPGADHPQAPGCGGEAAGATVPEVARELGISEATFHRWRNRYRGMSSGEARRLKELEKENARLKKLVAEQALDIDILKEVNRGNF